MSKPTRRDYDAYGWLPIERWAENTIMGPRLNQMIMCKICDKYVPYSEAEAHVESHVKTRKKQIAEDKKKAKAARIEAMRLARIEKKNAAGNS